MRVPYLPVQKSNNTVPVPYAVGSYLEGDGEVTRIISDGTLARHGGGRRMRSGAFRRKIRLSWK